MPLPILGFLIGAGGMVATLAACWGWLVWVHDPKILAEQKLLREMAVAKEQAASREAAIAALDTQAALSAALSARTQTARERVANAAPTSCPAAPDALRAAIMRHAPGTGNHP